MKKHHLDDLPARTDEHIGETESRTAVRSLLRDPLFIVRDECDNDYGVDVTVEVLDESGRPTNFRIHVQLKSSSKDSNVDGSYSYPVARNNLNYLLASAGSLYVFYSRREQSLLYRHAEDVYTECERAGPSWRSQSTITVRFTEPLVPTTLNALHQRILLTHRQDRDRRLKEILDEAKRGTVKSDKNALEHLASVFEHDKISPEPFVRATAPHSAANIHEHGPLGLKQREILDTIARYQVQHGGQPIGDRVLNVDDDDLAPLLRDRTPGPQFFRDQVRPNWVLRTVAFPENLRSYELTIWGWLDSTFGDGVRALLDSMLAHLRALETTNRGFESYTWAGMKAARVVETDSELHLVRAIWMCFSWPIGELDGSWRIPNDIKGLLKAEGHQELLRRRMLLDLRSEAQYHLYRAIS